MDHLEFNTAVNCYLMCPDFWYLLFFISGTLKNKKPRKVALAQVPEEEQLDPIPPVIVDHDRLMVRVAG